MILVGVGGNLSHPTHGAPPAPCEAAIDLIAGRGIQVTGRSPWYRSNPIPPSGQPDFVNGVVKIVTELPPPALMALLHSIEAELGRTRKHPNAARVIDLDLIDYGGQITAPSTAGPTLPHPRMAGRAFVLLPLRDVAPGWTHPVDGATVEGLISGLPEGQGCWLLGRPKRP